MQLQPLVRMGDAPEAASSSPQHGNGHVLPDWHATVATIALLATLLSAEGPVAAEGPVVSQAPSKEELVVLQGACELALQAMSGYTALASSGMLR